MRVAINKYYSHKTKTGFVVKVICIYKYRVVYDILRRGTVVYKHPQIDVLAMWKFHKRFEEYPEVKALLLYEGEKK